MKNLALIVLVLCFSCNKKNHTPDEARPEPAVKKNSYYFKSATSTPETRFADPKIWNFLNLLDTAYYELLVNGILVHKEKLTGFGSRNSGYVNFSAPSKLFYSGDNIKWTCNMISYNTGVTYSIFKLSSISIVDSLKKTSEAISLKIDTIPYVKSANTYTASKTWEFTAP